MEVSAGGHALRLLLLLQCPCLFMCSLESSDIFQVRMCSAAPHIRSPSRQSRPRIASQLATVVPGSSPERRSLASASLRPNCPVCGPTERSETSWSQAYALVARGADRGLGSSAIPNRQVRCRIKRAAQWSHSHTRVGNLSSANPSCSSGPKSFAFRHAEQPQRWPPRAATECF